MRLQGKSDFKSSFFSFLMMILMVGMMTAGSAIFTSCYNLFENVQPPVYQEENQPGNQTGAGNAGRTQPEPDPIVISGQLIFNGAVPQEVLSNVASDDASDRAAIPTFTSSEIDYFAVATSGTGANAKTAIGTFGAAGTADANTFTIALIPGRSWTITCGITVKGSTSESDRIMTAELPVPSDFTSGTTLQFFPAPDMTDSSATGQISLSMSIDSSIKYVDLAANSAFSSGWPSTLTSATIDAGGTTATISASVPVGTYEILMSFSDENHTLLYATTQTFTVCKGLTTRAWTTSGGESPINSSGVFSVSSTKIQTFAATNYYVGDTGAANASPASNNNSGSHKAPFLTLDKALTVVQSLSTATDADPTREYTIHICGTVDNSSTTTVPSIGSDLNGKLAKLTLRGKADTEHPPVIQNHNTSGRILNIATTVPVEITGLKITGGKATGSGNSRYGGALYLSGTNTNVTLNNAIIEANSAQYYGGGIYIDNGAKLTMKGTSSAIQDNGISLSSGGQGGGVYVAVGGTFLMENGTIARNRASSSGGGVYARGYFTMKNGTITSNARVSYSDTLSESSRTCNVEIGQPGTFNLDGGTITSDFTAGWTGAGVCLYSDNSSNTGTITFNMTAGSITGIITDWSGNVGNGVVYCHSNEQAESPIVFNMSGGSITGNTINSDDSGLTAAVCIGKYSTFNMTGGEISGNHSQNNGGGVCLAKVYGGGDPVFNLGKAGATSTVKIKENTAGDSNVTNNVFLRSNEKIIIAGTLSTDSEVGIYKAFSTAPLTSGYASTNNGTTPADIFTSDENYDVIASTVTGSVGEVALHIDERQIPLTLEAANSSATVSFNNKASGPVTYRINGGELKSIAAGVSKSISLDSSGDVVQFFGDNLKYGDSDNASCSRISCTADCYVYGNIMSLINSSSYEDLTELTQTYTFAYLFKGNSKIKNKTGDNLLLPATTLANYCYNQMFNGCTGLTAAPELPATTLADYCYEYMFNGCTGLTAAPELPATTLEDSCYRYMFQGCTGLTAAPELPATTLANYCYYQMFLGCTGLTAAPELPATTLAISCYSYMFRGCTGLTAAPELPATTLVISCYTAMFHGCTGLTAAPELPATTLADTCYSYMFIGCTGLTAAPELPATTLASSCYRNMFNGCTNLNSVTCLATDISASNCVESWLSGVASTGIFTKAPAMTDWPLNSASGIPSGWTVEEPPVPLTLEAVSSAATVTFINKASGPVTYKVNGGAAHTIASGFSEAIDLSAAGDKVEFFGDNAKYGASSLADCSKIECSAYCYVYGNIMSLVDSDDFASADTLTEDYTFAELFYNNSKIRKKTNSALRLPATTLTNYCYYFMFEGCTSLAAAPELPATTLANKCYSGMFSGCTNIATAPALTATTLAESCYSYMFNGCTGLTAAPVLSVTTLAAKCYQYMFKGCTNLAAAPALPATSLADYCYNNMFNGCTSLTTAPELPATTLKNACYSNMFEGCTNLATAPALPATTLASTCYNCMFKGCTSLTAAPELPATTLTTYCYKEMFYGCTNLNSVTCLATNISATDCTLAWLSNVASAGIFTKASDADWSVKTGASGIPSGWTISGGVTLENVTLTSASFNGSTTTGSTVVFTSGRNLGTIKSLIVSDHETTQGEYETYCCYGGSVPSSLYGDGDYYPAYNVSWYDAIIYCNLRSIHDGYNEVYSVGGITDPTQWTGIVGNSTSGYCAPSSCAWDVVIDDSKNGWRLPYEAEWEYIWREKNLTGTGQHTYCGGENINDLSWNDSNSSSSSHIVKTKDPNSLDIYDMCGNVWEWMNDWHSYPVPASAPITGVAYVNANPQAHVTRGGGWRSDPTDLTATRARNNSDNNARYNDLGFRVVRNAETTTTAYPKDSGYVGTKAPDDTKAVGDIVFNDGSAMAYADFTGLSTAVKNEKKKKAIALIFYKGTGLNSGSDTSERTLGVGIKNLMYIPGDEAVYTLAWCTTDAKAYDISVTSIECESTDRSSASGIITGDKDGSDNLEQIAAFLNNQSLENDTGVGVNSTKTPAEAAALYPAFYFAKNYKNQLIGSETVSRILTGSDFEDGWYFPSVAEVQYIYKNGIAASKVFDLNAANQALGGTSFIGSSESCEYVYASSSQEERDDHTSSYSRIKFTTLSPYAGAVGSMGLIDKTTKVDCICAIREF